MRGYIYFKNSLYQKEFHGPEEIEQQIGGHLPFIPLTTAYGPQHIQECWMGEKGQN